MRTGFIGCGKVAHFHADVLKNIGIDIAAISYRSNAENARNFQKKYGVPKIFSEWKSMVRSEDLDALWVLADWETIDDLLIPVMQMGIPVFFEKPVALSSDKIEKAINEFPEISAGVQVGYNRRFYKIVNTLKELLTNKRIVHIEIFIPESVNLSDRKLIRHRTLQNSSHLFDLLLYIIEDLELDLKYLEDFSSLNFETPGFTAIFKSNKDFSIYFSSIFNTPLNSCIRFYTDDQFIYELKPIEKLSIYKDFEILEPGGKQPIRLYNPKLMSETYETSDSFKPGFLDQAKAFFNKTIKYSNQSLPNLQTSLKVTEMIETITEGKK